MQVTSIGHSWIGFGILSYLDPCYLAYGKSWARWTRHWLLSNVDTSRDMTTSQTNCKTRILSEDSVRSRQDEDTLWRQHCLTWSCFPNVYSFCHSRNICGGHKCCFLDTKKWFWTISETFIAYARCATNVADVFHGRATSQGTKVLPQCVFVSPTP